MHLIALGNVVVITLTDHENVRRWKMGRPVPMTYQVIAPGSLEMCVSWYQQNDCVSCNRAHHLASMPPSCSRTRVALEDLHAT